MRVIKWVQVAFKIFRQVLAIAVELIQQLLSLFVYLTSLFLKVLVNPSTTCLFAIALFGVVMVITSAQWARVGVWVVSFFANQLRPEVRASAAFLGVCVGLGLNLFQQSSELWKVQRKITRFYIEKGIDPDIEEPTEEKDKAKHRLAAWLSYNHKNLKTMRRISYVVEAALLAGNTLLNGFGWVNLAWGLVAFICPELSLKFVSSAVSLLGSASAYTQGEPEEEYQV